jgi:hypothetical protein
MQRADGSLGGAVPQSNPLIVHQYRSKNATKFARMENYRMVAIYATSHSSTRRATRGTA